MEQTENAAHAMPVSPLLLQKPQLNKTSELPARKPRHLVRSTQQRKSSKHRSVPREQELFGQLQCCQYPDQFLHSSDHSFHSLTADQCCSKCPIQCPSNGGEAGDSTQTRRRVHFDFNGNGVGMRTRIELRNLMGQLLQHRKNCCLLRFSNQRRCSMLFLHQLLVRQLDNCLHTMKAKLIAVHLTYYDSKIDAVMKALQEYYDFKYNQKVIKISDCMRQLSTPKDTTEKTTLVTPAADLQWYQNRYKLAEIDLDHFLDDIKFSNLKADLMPIIVTKLKKLNKATMEYKVQKLRECKEQLDEIINSEIQMLQNFPRKASITNLNATWYFPGDTTAANIL